MRPASVLVSSYHAGVYVVEIPVQLSFGLCLPLELLKDLVPYPSLYPPIKAGGNTLPGAKPLWEVTPGGSGAIYPQDSLHHGAVIFGGPASRRFLRRKRSGAIRSHCSSVNVSRANSQSNSL